MKLCPRCLFPLKEIQGQDNTVIEHCKRCKGSFVPSEHLKEIYGPEIEPENWLKLKTTKRLGLSELFCPRDESQMELYRIYLEDEEGNPTEEQIEIDVCPTCHGIWFDAKEGQKLSQIMKKNLHQIRVREKIEAEKNARKEKLRDSHLLYFFQLFTGLPFEEYNPVRRKPIALYVLMGIMIAIYLSEVTIYKISGVEGLNQIFLNWGFSPLGFKDGKFYSLFSALFVHSAPSPLHLVGNLYFFYTFGDNIEDLLGRGKFLLIFFIAGIAGNLLWYSFHPTSPIPLVGASGAISGLMGAYMVLFPWVKLWVVIFFTQFRISAHIYILFWIGYQLLMMFINAGKGASGIAWEAHVGGFFAGVILALIWKKEIKKKYNL